MCSTNVKFQKKNKPYRIYASKHVQFSLFLIFFNPELSFLNVFTFKYEFIPFKVLKSILRMLLNIAKYN